jgi:hypothetical protein
MNKIIIVILVLNFNLSFSQTRLDTMIYHLRQADFSEVISVKRGIINEQKLSIPKLVSLLKDTTFIKLENTADLIYPGATKYYGHGSFLKYDIDWISIRSAWLLEELTFQNFGFKEIKITEEKLIQLHKQNYSNKSIDYKNMTEQERLKVYRQILSESVSKWWKKNKNTWSRFKALKDALASTNEERQSLALNYILSGYTYCDGLTLEKYKKELEPLIEKIQKQNGEQSDRAKYILDDKDYNWFKTKWAKNRFHSTF